MKSASIHHSSFNLQAFFQKFGLFADAPGAVARMRELVLRVAFSGGLSGKRMTEVGVPKGWESRTIASISSLITPGFACSRSHQVENGYVHLRTHNISTLGTLNFDLLVRIDPQMVDPQKASIRAGEILFNNTNSQELVGKTCLVDRDYEYGFSNHITRIRLNDGIFPGFVVFYFTLLRNSGYFARLCTRWINQAAVNTDTLKKQMIPLPPLAEQKRIVAKVDQLMALLDELEAQQKEREEKKAALVRASLARFADAPTPANLNCIFHSSYNIPPSDLRKSILTLAVQGKLVPQDPNDEPAEHSLARLAMTKLLLQKAGAIGKVRPCEPLQPESHLFEVPESWCWARLAELTELITKGSSPKWQGVAYVPESEGVLFITSENVGNYVLRKLDNLKYVSKEFNEIEPRSMLRQGDILMNLVGASIGRTAVYDLHDGANINQAVALIRLVRETDAVCPRFVLHYLNSPSAIDYMLSSRVVNAQPNISLTDAREFAIPIPPLAEQHRIVAKVDELMALVDELEAQLAASKATGEKLLAVLVAELTTGQKSQGGKKAA
jgi:type I restriction enzyme, S subunit